MLAQISQWILIAAFGQAPSEAALLKAAPADVDVAVRIRGVEATRDDLLAMLKAMNPEWANMAEGALAGPLEHFSQMHGGHASKTPFLTLMRFGEAGGEGGPPPFAALVPSDNYQGTLKELSGGKDVELKHQDGDYDAFDGPGGQGTWYAAKAPGIVAFGPSKELIASVAKRGGKTLDSVLTGSGARSFTGGDIGVYVNAASLTKRYADQIEQARQGLMAVMDQAGQQAGNAGQVQFIKDFYGGMFDSLKYADVLTLNLDVAEKGLHLAAFLKAKADADIAKSISETRTGDAGTLGNLAPGAMAYAYMNVASETFDRFMGMSLRMMAGGGKASPELEKAMAEFHGLGRIESIGSMSMEKGMRGLNDIKVDDPKKFINASLSMLRGMSGGEGQVNLYKEFKVDPDAQTHQGLTFTHASATVNLDKLAELSGNNPAQLETMKAMFGDGRISYWYGTDGKRVLQVVAPNWEDARSLIDPYLGGNRGVAQGAGFKSVRGELPEQVSFLMLFSSQALVRMFATQFAALTKNPNLKPPEDMPAEPAYLGVSLTPHPSEGFEVHLVIPSPVGTVIAKGMIPIFQGLAPPGANP
jgi:hypothetical protein